jgi:hypothetical protein
MAKRALVDLVVDRYINLDLFYRKQEVMPNGCIEWRGPQNNAGYGFIGFKPIDPTTGMPGSTKTTRMMTVHRLQFLITHGKHPTKPNVNHTCHNKLCLNPLHLVEGTQTQKVRDMRSDGIKMGGRPLGSTGYAYDHKQHNRTYKYSEDDIQWHRTAPLQDIATRYNISIVKAGSKQWNFRQNYRWLPLPEGIPVRKPGRPKKQQ